MTTTTAPAAPHLERPLHINGRYADIDWVEYRRRCNATTCPRPRCTGRAGDGQGRPGTECTTPNGHGTGFHREREQAAGVRPAPGNPNNRYRLSEAAAERIEWAAEAGVYYAPDKYAVSRGEARERTIADVLVREGLVEEDPNLPTSSGTAERRLVLTAAGWDVYWHHRLIIRRLDGPSIDQHAEHCPRCTRTGTTTPRKAHA